MIRPDWRTVTRPRTPTGGADVVALAADVGTCSHGRTADLYEVADADSNGGTT